MLNISPDTATANPVAVETQAKRRWRAAEFFAGIGMSRRGLLRAGVDVVWSNDIAPAKHAMFERNFDKADNHTFVTKDLREVSADHLPADLDLAWASFPCTDLSVAGGRAGLHRGTASSTFWHFVKVLSRMGPERPPLIAIENVNAFAKSHDGRDISSAIKAFNGLGYVVDVVSIDARHFVPQSRPRLFLIGTSGPVIHGPGLFDARPKWLDGIFENPELRTFRLPLPPLPPPLVGGLGDYLEPMEDDDERWWPKDRVAAYVSSLSTVQWERFEHLRDGSTTSFRTAFRRMRDGVPRWEMREDGLAGCLRTSRGGSSKQAVVVLGSGHARIRWMTPREYAALMGAPDFPVHEFKPHHAYSGFGDAVCAPVVSWLAENHLVPLLSINEISATAPE
jgi:DNA (cytosine-5)-methyltransferase 1